MPHAAAPHDLFARPSGTRGAPERLLLGVRLAPVVDQLGHPLVGDAEQDASVADSQSFTY